MPKPPKKTSSTPDATPAKPVTLNEALVAGYPDDFVVQYVFAPVAKTPRRMLRAILAIGTVITVSRQICDRWNTVEVCSARTNYLLYATEFLLVATIIYCWYLRSKMAKRTRLAAKPKA
ncbi:hypothetical protein MBLNU13_g10387t2 [Cladosporium sp. NU13]